jgi:hypothetical protein
MTAALAFISGAISLITNTFFDDKDTAKMYEGAGAYGDRVGVLLNKPGLTGAEAHAAYGAFTEQSGKLAKDCDHLLDAGAPDQIANNVLEALTKYKKDTTEEERSKLGSGSRAPAYTAGSGVVLVSPMTV